MKFLRHQLPVLERDLPTPGAGRFHLDRTKDLTLCREEIVPVSLCVATV